MSKIILSTIFAVSFLFVGLNSHADNEHSKDASAKAEQATDNSSENMDHSELSGKVTSVDGDTVKFKSADGIEHTVNITGFQDLQEMQPETLEEGDRVQVMMRNGKPYAISKVSEGWALPDVDVPDPSVLVGTTTVRGKVTKVDGDVITFKDNKGNMHTADITGFQNIEELETETIEEGDIVVVNMRDGKPYGVAKHTEAWLLD